MSSNVSLVRRRAAAAVPALDPAQRRVVEHGDGPLLVLAGPGTGKTTTLVESVVERIQNRGVDADQVLALTFSRKAAHDLRDRVTARLGRTVSSPVSMTFHSFAYALVRRFTPAELYAEPLRLLSSPQADLVLQELLADEELRPRLPWPSSLGEAVNTRGFSREVEAVLSRAREKGGDPYDLVQLARRHPEAPELMAAGILLDNYLTNLDHQGATDYADLVRRAVIEAREHRAELRADFPYVFVDEYQDTDPGQVELLRALAGDGGNLTVFGDPRQSIYGFRGAELRGLLDFPEQFRTATGERAPVEVLDTAHRFGSSLLEAASRVAHSLGTTGAVPAQAWQRFVAPRPADGLPADRVEVFTYDSERAEAERIADLLRRAHLDDGVAWSDMAVLVRTGGAGLPVLRRLLSSAGVPVEVADDVPLGQEPAVQTLLQALELVTREARRRRAEEKIARGAWEDSEKGRRAQERAEAQAAWTPRVDHAEALLRSPLAGMAATPLRSLARALRQHEVAAAASEQRPARSSGELVALSLVREEMLETVDEEIAAPAVRLRALLADAVAGSLKGEDLEKVLWRLWSGTPWGDSLRATVLRGGLAAARAHRDLDALTALVASATKAVDQKARIDPLSFVAEITEQQIPADSLADKGVRGDTVQLLTTHRAKGLEWKIVVVAHVQEGAWPDLRRRATLLGADRIGAPVYGELALVDDVSRAVLLAEERRLFHVACTRATERLVVTAVQGWSDDAEMPSRFLDDVLTTPAQERAGARPVRAVHQHGRPSRPLTLNGMVAELRRTVADPAVGEPLREAAARRLAALAAEEVSGRQLVPAADPRTWWGTAGATKAAEPVRPPTSPVKLSASTVQSIAECPARWFLEREAGGSSFSGQSAAFGNVVHKIAEHVNDPAVTEVSLDELMELVDAVWDQLPFATPWSRELEREQARLAIERFLNRHHDHVREVVGTEIGFSFVSTLPDGEKVHLRGFADRVEVDAQGHVVVVDLKTVKNPPTDASMRENAQLGIYQYAVEHGGFSEHLPEGSRSGGAELWQLRKSSNDHPKIQVQAKQDPDEEGWVLAERQLAATAKIIRSEAFDATPGKHCTYCSFASLCPARTTTGVLS